MAENDARLSHTGISIVCAVAKLDVCAVNDHVSVYSCQIPLTPRDRSDSSWNFPENEGSTHGTGEAERCIYWPNKYTIIEFLPHPLVCHGDVGMRSNNAFSSQFMWYLGNNGISATKVVQK